MICLNLKTSSPTVACVKHSWQYNAINKKAKDKDKVQGQLSQVKGVLAAEQKLIGPAWPLVIWLDMGNSQFLQSLASKVSTMMLNLTPC